MGECALKDRRPDEVLHGALESMGTARKAYREALLSVVVLSLLP